MTKWITVAPIVSDYNTRHQLEISFNDIKIIPIPEWIRNQEISKDLSTYQRMRLEDAELMFISEYEANALGDPDHDWVGDKPRSKQELAAERITICNLALWLAKPSFLSFELVLHIQNPETNPLVRQSYSIEPLRPHFKDERNFHERVDYQIAEKLKLSIQKLERKFSVWMSIRASVDALTTRSWEVRFMLLWIVLESLFGNDSEVKYRLSLRISFFLSKDKKEAEELFSKIKTSYDLRCKIVHGLKIEEIKKKREESAEIMHYTESYVRQAIIKILLDNRLIQTFNNENERKQYLDALVFI